jgi:hypothetical protein
MADIFDDLMKEAATGGLEPAGVDPNADPIFDNLMREAENEEKRKRNVSILRQQAGDQDAYGDAKILATNFDVPTDFAMRNKDRLEKFKGFTDTARMFENNGKLASFFVKDDNADAIKVDELRHLDGLSWFYRSAVEAFRSGQGDVDLANLRYKQLMGTASGDEISRADMLSAGREPRTFAADSWMEKSWVGASKQLPIMGEMLLGGAEQGIKGAVYGGTIAAAAGQMGPQVALPEELITVPGGMAAGFTVGSTAGQWLASFRLEAGLSYDEFKNFRDENGKLIDDDVARGAAIVAGSASSLLETYGFRKLASIVPGLDKVTGTLGRDSIKAALSRPTVRLALASFVKNVGVAAGTEVTTELAQEALTIFAGEVAKGYAGEEGAQFDMLDAGQIGERMADTFEQTLQAMTIMGPALATTRLGHDVRRAQQATRDLRIIEALGNHAEGNELNVRLPEKAKEAIRDLTKDGPVEWVYISPDAFSTYFQSAEEASQFAAAVDLTDEYNESQRLGRDMEIPIDTYYVNIAGTEIGKAIQQFVKLTPDAMSASEAERFNLEWDEAQQQLKEEYKASLDGEQLALEGEETIFEDVKTKAMDAGMVPDQATQYAKLYSNFFRVMAQRSGQDAGALYATYGLDIKRALPGEAAYKAVDNLDLALEAVRRGRIDPLRKRVEKASGPSLLQAIIARGGIVDTDGELAGMDLPRGVVRAGDPVEAPRLEGVDENAPAAMGEFNQYGADDTMRQMWEDGYFPEFSERPTANQLYDAIRAEASGERRFSATQSRSDDPGVEQARGLVQFADLLDKAGLDPATMTNDEIRAAIDEIVNADPDTAALYQEASARALTDTPEFKEWFGDSKVVDENGEPLVVYHGATAADFEAFDAAADAKHIALPGIFFTPSAAKAADFASSASRKEFRDRDGYIEGYEGAATVPVYLSVKNPATISLDDRETGVMSGHAQVREALNAAREAGHDGAIITGWADGSGDVQYVAFDPTQIKSVNNRGTFDASDPRILYQTGQQTEGIKRGSIQLAPGRTIINLFDQADMSTFLHESGHFFLEVFRDLAAQQQPVEVGPQSAIVEDWRKVQEYLGIGDDGVISTEAHEKFARTFEAYLFEGKAPSAEVASIMARFRSWLAFVYKSVDRAARADERQDTRRHGSHDCDRPGDCGRAPRPGIPPRVQGRGFCRHVRQAVCRLSGNGRASGRSGDARNGHAHDARDCARDDGRVERGKAEHPQRSAWADGKASGLSGDPLPAHWRGRECSGRAPVAGPSVASRYVRRRRADQTAEGRTATL